jgi:ABC-2 type transport system permease protein
VSGLGAAFRCELLKMRRSRVPLLTALGFTLAPFMGALFMVVMKDPAQARSWGLVSTKAQIFAGTADWPTYLGLLGQTVAVGGWLLFSVLTAWVFGREFADQTVKTLLAVPTSRSATVVAKLAGIGLVSGAITLWVVALGIALGFVVGLPGGSTGVLAAGVVRIGAVALLTLGLLPVIALVASAGRGYLAPLAAALLLLFIAQVVAALGWGEFFPWAVPALLSGAAGPEAARLGPWSWVLAAVVTGVGVAGTLVWWQRADQTT